MLEVENVTTTYGGIVAVRDASLRVPRGRIVALIGGNSAGKTTLLHTICGICRSQQGEIRLDGESLSGLPTHRIARRGVLLVPEGRQILGAALGAGESRVGAARSSPSPEGVFETDLDGVFRMFPRLGGACRPHRRLAQRRRAADAGDRARADGWARDPAARRARVSAWRRRSWRRCSRCLQSLNQAGLTILLVEQKARRALEIAHEGYVMERGRIVDSGPCELLRNNPGSSPTISASRRCRFHPPARNRCVQAPDFDDDKRCVSSIAVD